MKVFVDGDACPVTQEVIDLTEAAELPVRVVHSRHHEISYDYDHVKVIETGDRSDAADHEIFNNVSDGDVVVTDDLGLTALVLNRGAEVIRFRGGRPSEDDIDMRLAMREASRRERQRTGRGSGPPKFTEEDRERFRRNFRAILSEIDDGNSTAD
jgi:hypothetical protein